MPSSGQHTTLQAVSELDSSSLCAGFRSFSAQYELQALTEAFKLFVDSLSDADATRASLVELHIKLHADDFVGEHALEVLARNKQFISWETMDADHFTNFYRFTFFLLRDLGKRNVQVLLAVQGWQLLLKGRFRLLDKWCTFVEMADRKIITEDTWRQVLDFSRTVHEDLGNYDEAGAWPVLLDDFVEHLRGQAASYRSQAGPASSSYISAPGLSATYSAPISPCPGSKRRATELDNVTEQLQAMPPLRLMGSPAAAPSSPSHNRTPQKRLCARRAHPTNPFGAPQLLPAVDSDMMSPGSEGASPMWSTYSDSGGLPHRLSAVHEILQQTVTEALGLGTL